MKERNVKEHANRSLVFSSEVDLCECYWYAENHPVVLDGVCHNHSVYFIDISDHSGRFTDSLFFRSLRWIDVPSKHEILSTARSIHSILCVSSPLYRTFGLANNWEWMSVTEINWIYFHFFPFSTEKKHRTTKIQWDLGKSGKVFFYRKFGQLW